MATKPAAKLRQIRTARDRVASVLGKRARAARSVRCIAYPNRTKAREFNAKAAGRVVCAALTAETAKTNNHELAVLRVRSEVNRCLPCVEATAPERSVQQAVAVANTAADSLRDTITTMAVAISVLAALAILVRFATAIPLALLPTGGAIAVRTAIQRIPVALQRMQTQQAANQASYRSLEAARAANDSSTFLRAVGF